MILKSDNLQYDKLGHWVYHLIDQVSDGPSIILIENKTVGCWLGLRALKTLYFYFGKVSENEKIN